MFVLLGMYPHTTVYNYATETLMSRNACNGNSGQKSPEAGNDLNEVIRSAPYKVEKVIKMVNLSLQLFQERLSQKLHTRQSWIVIWDMINTLVLDNVAVKPTFVAFLLPFFEIYLKNSELKTTHNSSQDCRVHFFQQPFSKQLYTCWLLKRADPIISDA